MVFKTLSTGLNNFINKSWDTTLKDLEKKTFKNPLNAFFKTYKSGDNDALKNYIADLDKGVTRTQAFTNNLSNASATAKQQAVEIAKLNTQYKTGTIDEQTYTAKLQALGVQTETVSIKTRLATTAFQMFKVALTAIAITVIIQGISLLVNSLSDLANNVSKTKEKVKSLTDEFNTAISTANDNAKRIEELIDNYDKLSDGVNNLGENISLTNEEYDEYKSLTNEIADMFPNLIQGYDNEGNAVLNLKGNVEQLRDAYKEAQQEAYNLLIIGGKDGDGNDIIKQWQDTQDTNFWAKLFDLGDADVYNGISISQAVEQLQEFLNMSTERYKEIQEIYTAAYSDAEGLFDFDFANEYAKSSGYDLLSDSEYNILKDGYLRKALGLDNNISEEDFTNAKKQAKALVQTYNTEIESALSGTRSLANAYLNRNDDFGKLDESSQKAASVIVNSLDADIANQLTTPTAFSTFTDDIVNAFKNEDVQEAANSLFTLDTSSMSVGEINSEIDKYIDIIANAIGEDSDKLKIRLGFDDTNETLERAKAKFKIQANSAMSGLQDGIYDFLENLSLSDLNIAMQIPDLFDDGLSKASEKIKEWKQNPDNNPASFDYSTYSEDVDKVAKNIDKVQSALDKLNSGKTVDNKDITELADAFPEYSTKILAASDDTEKLKAVLTEVKTNAPRSLIDTLSNLKDLSTDDQEAVNGLITMLESLGGASSTYADILNDLDTKQSLLSSAYKEMHDDGQISVDTYQKLITLGDDYANVVSIVDGKLTLNIESLKELTKKKYDDEIATLRLARAEEWHNAVTAGKNGEDTSKYTKIIENIDAEIDAKKQARDLLDKYDYTTTVSTKKKTDDPWKDQFEKEYNEKQHLLNMNKIDEDEYINWLDGAYKQYFSDLTKYQDEYNKYEEEVYKYRTEREEKLFDKKIDNLEKLADKALDDKIEIPDVNKELEEFNKKMQSEYGLGNVDLTKRPKVAMDDGTTATVLSSSEFLWQGDEENGEYVAVHYTPILPDGTILDDDTLAKYLYETLEGFDDILKADTKGLVLKVDTGLGITDEDFNSLETDNPTQHIQDIIKACDDWDVALHNIQEQWLDVSEAAENATTTATNKFDYAREQINSAIAETQARIDGIKNGTISGDNDDIEQLTDDLDSLYDKLTDINEKEIDSQKEYIKTLKDEYSDLIDEQIDQQKKLADNIEKAFEKQIDNIDKQIDAINKVNEAEEHQKNILEAQEAVKEAQKNLDKASVNTRLVYTGNGGYALRSDKDAVEEAKKTLADKQAELQKAMDEQKIAVLEEQKQSLEDQKKASKDYYDTVTDNLEEQKTAREKQYDLLIDIYEQLGGEKKQTSLNDSLVSKLTANGDINKAVQGLTPTEMQKAITSGILTTDSDGNYAIDYSILGENEKAVNDNTAELQKTKSELEKLNNSLSGDTSNTNSSATSKVDATKPHLDANGYLVDANGKQILNDGKPIHAKNFSEEIAKTNTNEKVAKAVSGVGKFAGYETMNDLFKAMSLGEFTIPQPVADSVRNPYLNNRIAENLTKAGEQVATNSNVNNNSPVINFTVQVDGSADEKTISKMKTEISNTLVECFNYWGNSMDTAFTRQINKS